MNLPYNKKHNRNISKKRECTMYTVLNYIPINNNLTTSGQPTPQEFEAIALDKYEIVINLALCTSTNALKDENKLVTELGMTYIHIPVDFEEPSVEHLKQFLRILSSLDDKKVWIHCTKNYRVTAFMYVFHKYIYKTPFEEIDLSLLEEWCPNEKWQELMKITPENL